MKCPIACSECDYAGLLSVAYNAHMVTHTEENEHKLYSTDGDKRIVYLNLQCLWPLTWPVCDISMVYFILWSLRPFGWSECDYTVRIVVSSKEHMDTYADYSTQTDMRSVLQFGMLYILLISCTKCDYTNRNVVYIILLCLRPFACSECDYAIKIGVTYKEHMETHTGNSTMSNIKRVLYFNLLCLNFYIFFGCPECDYTGQSVVLCKDHMQTHIAYNKVNFHSIQWFILSFYIYFTTFNVRNRYLSATGYGCPECEYACILAELFCTFKLKEIHTGYVINLFSFYILQIWILVYKCYYGFKNGNVCMINRIGILILILNIRSNDCLYDKYYCLLIFFNLQILIPSRIYFDVIVIKHMMGHKNELTQNTLF